MSALHRSQPPARTMPADPLLHFDAIGEAAALAASYAQTVAEGAAIGDLRLIAYATKAAARALTEVATLAEEMRPSQGGRAT